MGESGLAFIFNVEEGREEEERREKTWFAFTSTQEYTDCTEICKISQEYVRVYRSMQEFTEVCKSLQGYARVCMKWYTVLFIRVCTFDLLGSHSAKSPDCLPSTHV